MTRILAGIGLVLIGTMGSAHAEVEKVRAMFRDDPATSVVIGWNQLSGSDPVLRYGTTDFGTDAGSYDGEASPDRVVQFRGMNNHYVRLGSLEPDTRYYFVIEDSEGVSARYWVLTGPAGPEPFTFVTGGDTKSTGGAYAAGQETNRMVTKLRPLFVMFTGDMNSDDGTNEQFWDDWLDNWSAQTTTADGRLIPLVAVHGNHENGDYTTVNKLFDTPDADSEYSYFSLTFGAGLLHVIALNSELQNGDAPPNAFNDQLAWLQNDLATHQDATFRIAGYHKPLRPHTSSKSEQLFLQQNWAPLFDTYALTMACESDSHMHKYTFPLRYCDDAGAGCFQNFRRDDDSGVFYVGEGSWGASPRASDDNKPWTIQSQSFNQLKWHRVIPDNPKTRAVDAAIEVRTVVTVTIDGDSQVTGVEALTEDNKYSAIPEGIELLTLPFFGDHIRLPFVTPVGDVPTAPSELIAEAVSFSEVQLDWTNTAGPDTVTNIEVQLRVGADGVWRNAGFLPADADSFEVEQLVDDGEHFFRVRATNLFGDSSFSNTAVAVIPEDTRQRAVFIQGYPVYEGETELYDGAVDLGLLEALPDTLVDGISPENPFALMFADNNSGQGDREQALIRFNGIVERLPEQARIDQAVLTLVSADATADIISLHTMLRDWPADATWSTFGADGIQLNDVDAVLDAVDSRSTGIEFLQSVTFDVTGSVLRWLQEPAANYGWVVVNSGSDGWDTPQSEIPSPLTIKELGVFDVQPRPELTVFFTIAGDLDSDGDVDSDDVDVILQARNGDAIGPDDPRDINGDRRITIRDARLLALQCTRPQCATEDTR